MHRTPRALQTPLTTGIKTVTSIAVRCPTITAAGESLPSGHCYLMLPPAITLRDLIVEKVAAEMRKARAAGRDQSTLQLLVDDDNAQWLPLEWLRNAAEYAALDGRFTVTVDGQLVTDLDALIAVTRATSIAFIVAAPVLA